MEQRYKDQYTEGEDGKPALLGEDFINALLSTRFVRCDGPAWVFGADTTVGEGTALEAHFKAGDAMPMENIDTRDLLMPLIPDYIKQAAVGEMAKAEQGRSTVEEAQFPGGTAELPEPAGGEAGTFGESGEPEPVREVVEPQFEGAASA
jgi:hypothetical protein